MSFIAWIILGLIAGFIASKIVNKSGEGVLLDIILGIVGAVVGGYLFQTFGAAGVSGVNLYSILVAVVGRHRCTRDLSRDHRSRGARLASPGKAAASRPPSFESCKLLYDRRR